MDCIKKLPKEMDRSKQRIFEILIFYRLGFVITLKCEFYLKIFLLKKIKLNKNFLLAILSKFLIKIISDMNFIKNHPGQS